MVGMVCVNRNENVCMFPLTHTYRQPTTGGENMANIIVNADLQEQIDTLNELLKKMSQVEDKAKEITFLTVSDLAKMTGWSKTTVRELFNRKDFPCCDFGKEKIAEINAVRAYFGVPRRD